ADRAGGGGWYDLTGRGDFTDRADRDGWADRADRADRDGWAVPSDRAEPADRAGSAGAWPGSVGAGPGARPGYPAREEAGRLEGVPAQRTAGSGSATQGPGRGGAGTWTAARHGSPGAPQPVTRLASHGMVRDGAPAGTQSGTHAGPQDGMRTGPQAWMRTDAQGGMHADAWGGAHAGPHGDRQPGTPVDAPAGPRAELRTDAQAPTAVGPQGGALAGAEAGPRGVGQADKAGADEELQVAAPEPVGRAEGRWLRGARRTGGARFAGAPLPEAQPFTMPPGHPSADTPLRGARFGSPTRRTSAPPEPMPSGEDGRGAGAWDAEPGTAGAEDYAGAHVGAGAGAVRDGRGDPVRGLVGALVGLRAQGRSGEAHALLCEAATWPAHWLPGLGEELGRAGLAADWATLLWEAASLPPARFAAAAAALGPADCDAMLRQGAARPAAELAEAALALGSAGRTREADALLEAFVRVRTAEESARLARRDPRWFAPRLLRAAEALSGTHHRDLLHALRVANLPVS
ncbi:hypothetical protein ACWGDE_28665, partial [Streptomyces sp. NPDC054956]